MQMCVYVKWQKIFARWRLEHLFKMLARFSNLKVGIRELSIYAEANWEKIYNLFFIGEEINNSQMDRTCS